MTDPIADMVTQIRNAGAVQKDAVVLPYSKLKHAIADVLLAEGFISSVEKIGKDVKKSLRSGIAYNGTTPRISGASRVSKYSQRRYAGFRDLYSVKQGRGMYILSTPHGIMNDKTAREKNVGGEVMLKIW